MIIAVDGPTASGKGTIAKALAKHYRLPHLDSGLLYRAAGRQVVLNGGDPGDPADAERGADFPDDLLNDPILRSEATGQLASVVSVHPGVRAKLLKRQQDFANQPGGALLDGRDIGTVIAPHADVKLFVTADVAVRALRRFLEMRDRGESVTLELIEDDLRIRDERDRTRPTSPLVAATDAVLLDTSEMDAEEAVAEAIRIVEERRRR
ncbi:MAG: d(CMP) kinase [Candidatus Andeanibacterium colombiense]|uniref:Cytidylate kinase n=1 Tax=Candidatus Andeanibacterium colombiense TaxID=3121345 RepID=A0AAJ6BQA4_9SPHN|nr:MAG: d(CMP) kinase [Sphingomonadaceae bacterium]